MLMDDCVFCKIVRNEIPASVELETNNLIAFKSADPAAQVHVLVVPKKHIEEFIKIGKGDYPLLAEMAKVVQTLIKKNGVAGAYKLIFNGGKFPGVRHLHWHVLGGKMKADLHKRI